MCSSLPRIIISGSGRQPVGIVCWDGGVVVKVQFAVAEGVSAFSQHKSI